MRRSWLVLPITILCALLLCDQLLAADKIAFGRAITIEQGERVNDVVSFGGPVTVLGEVEGDVVGMGGSVSVSGVVRGDVVAIGGSVKVSGSIGGDAVAISGSLELLEQANVGGDAVSVGGRVTRDPTSTVGGQVSTMAGPMVAFWSRLSRLHFWLKVCFCLFYLILAAFLLLVFPANVVRAGDYLRSDPLKCALIGLIASVASFVFCLVLALTIIGIPLALLLGLFYLACRIFGIVSLFYLIGNSLAGKRGSLGLWVFLGWAVAAMLRLIPYAGFWLWLCLAMLGVGASIASKFGSAHPWIRHRAAVSPVAHAVPGAAGSPPPPAPGGSIPAGSPSGHA